MSKYLRMMIVGACLAQAAMAAKVLKVAAERGLMGISNEANNPWKQGDGVCQDSGNEVVQVGTIKTVRPKGAIAQLESSTETPKAGDEVHKCSGGGRNLAADGRVEAGVPQGQNPLWDLSIGMSTGFDYLYPFFHAQVGVSPQFSLGLQPFFSTSSPATGESLQDYGAFFTGTYFFNPGRYKGFFLEGEAGVYRITGTAGGITETASPFSLAALFGWNGLHAGKFNFAIAAGPQYVLRKKLPAGSIIEFGGLLPKVDVQVGLDF